MSLFFKLLIFWGWQLPPPPCTPCSYGHAETVQDWIDVTKPRPVSTVIKSESGDVFKIL